MIAAAYIPVTPRAESSSGPTGSRKLHRSSVRDLSVEAEVQFQHIYPLLTE